MGAVPYFANDWALMLYFILAKHGQKEHLISKMLFDYFIS